VTVRHLALQLYHWMQRVEELKKAMAELAPVALMERLRLETELSQV